MRKVQDCINRLRASLFTLRSLLSAFYFIWNWGRKRYTNNLVATGNLSKVLHINKDAIGGGAARVAIDLVRFQRAKGIESNLMIDSFGNGDSFVHFIKKVESRKSHFLSHAEKKLQYQDFFRLSSFGIKDDNLFKSADIIHLHNLHSNYFSYLALPEISSLKPVVWSIHDMHAVTGHCAYSLGCPKWESACGECPDLSIYPSINKDTTAFVRKMKQESFKKSRLHIVALSKWLKDILERSILKDHPIHLLYNGVDTSVFKYMDSSDLRNRLGISWDKKVILFSANSGLTNPFKGGKHLIDVVQSFAGREDILFIALGGGESIVMKEKNLMLVPYVSHSSEMAQYYSMSDVFIHPTLADNCPLVVLEAMSCGTPVLAFNVGGLPELVLHKETGFLANYKDSQDLVRGLNWILEESERHAILADYSRRRVLQYFTIEKMNQNYMDLYKQVLQI
jgi:glycosyltransferase involved in cell wall biosynthesis